MARLFVPTSGSTARYLYAAPANSPVQGTRLTVCAWVYPTSLTGVQQVVGRDEDTSADRVYQFRHNAGKCEGTIFIGGVAKNASGATSLNLNAWNFLAITHDGSNVKAYLNSGTADGTTVASGDLDADPVGISIGARSRVNDGSTILAAHFGAIGEAAEWTRALSTGELDMLAAGYSPSSIRNGLNWYCPIIGNNDPEFDPFSGLQLKLTTITSGTADKTGHPRIIYPRRRGARFVSSSAATQNLQPSLFTESDAFFSATVSPGAVGLTPALFAETDSFFTPTVTGAYALTPSLFSESDVFYAATVAPGAVGLTPGLFTETDTFYTPTVAPGTITLQPALFAESDTFYTPVVAPGAVTLQPSLFADTDTFYTPRVALPEIALTAGLFVESDIFLTPTVTPGAVSLPASLFTETDVFHAPAVAIVPPPAPPTTRKALFSTSNAGNVGYWKGLS